MRNYLLEKMPPRGNREGGWGRLGESAHYSASLTLRDGEREGRKAGRKPLDLGAVLRAQKAVGESSSQICPAESCVSQSLAGSSLWEATLNFPAQQPVVRGVGGHPAPSQRG